MAAVEEAVAKRPAEARRHAGRIDALRALPALRARALSADALGGLYEDVRQGVTGRPFSPAPPARGTLLAISRGEHERAGGGLRDRRQRRLSLSDPA